MRFFIYGGVLVMLGVMTFMYLGGDRVFTEYRARQAAVAAEKRAADLDLAQDRYWRAFYRDPADCTHPRSHLRALECRNMRDQAWGYFRRDWANKLASGWIPPGVDQ